MEDLFRSFYHLILASIHEKVVCLTLNDLSNAIMYFKSVAKFPNTVKMVQIKYAELM